MTHQAEVRVIAATNRGLKKRMSEGAFREDLYFRLNVITAEIPPLRLCPEDLMKFAQHHLTSSIAEAARILGVDDATIYRKRKKMGLDNVQREAA